MGWTIICQLLKKNKAKVPTIRIEPVIRLMQFWRRYNQRICTSHGWKDHHSWEISTSLLIVNIRESPGIGPRRLDCVTLSAEMLSGLRDQEAWYWYGRKFRTVNIFRIKGNIKWIKNSICNSHNLILQIC